MALDNAKKLVDVLADAGVALEKVVDDKGGVLAKISHLIPLSGDAVTLAGVDFKALKGELAALDAAGQQALVAELAAKLQLDHAAVAAAVVQGLDLAIEIEGVVMKVIAFAKSLKPAPVAAAPAPAAAPSA